MILYQWKQQFLVSTAGMQFKFLCLTKLTSSKQYWQHQCCENQNGSNCDGTLSKKLRKNLSFSFHTVVSMSTEKYTKQSHHQRHDKGPCFIMPVLNTMLGAPTQSPLGTYPLLLRNMVFVWVTTTTRQRFTCLCSADSSLFDCSLELGSKQIN